MKIQGASRMKALERFIAAACTIWPRNSCTMSLNSLREGDFQIARARHIDLALDQDAAGPLRHDEDAVGKKHRLAQIVRDQNHGDSARGMQVADHAPQLLAREASSAPNGSSSIRSPARESARGRARCAAACRRTIARENCCRSRQARPR